MNRRLSDVCQNADGTNMRWEIENFSSEQGDEADTVFVLFHFLLYVTGSQLRLCRDGYLS